MSLSVTICIPAYRADRYLQATLDSVAAQTHEDWELIVVEDGSADRAEAMVKAFAGSVTQDVRYFRHAENRGLPATRNTAIEAARHGWIALLDADDLWEPAHLASLVAIAELDRADLIHSGSVLFDSDTGAHLGVRTPSAAEITAFPLSLFKADYIIQPASVLLRRESWRQVGGFDPAFRYHEDRDMWLRLARDGARFACSGLETCRYRRHGTALSTHSAEMAEASAAVYTRHLDWADIPGGLRQRLAAEAWAAAGRLRQRRHPARAHRHFQRACATDWRPGWWLRSRACALLAIVRPREPAAP